MKHFLTLLKHELKSILISPASYLAAFFFLIVMGLIYQLVLQDYNKSAQELLPNSIFFNAFIFPVLFLVPLLTMRSIAEERRLGLMDSLLTTPINSIELVASKFTAVYSYYCFLCLLTLAYPAITYHFFPDERILDKASLIGGFAIICSSGLLYISIGILASSLARSQLVAGLLTFSMLFGLILGVQMIKEKADEYFESYPIVSMLLEYIQVVDHVRDFSRGVLDTRPIILYVSGSLLMLSIAVLAVDHKR